MVRGERLGMIRFGSRVDVTIPENFDILCKKGDKVTAGMTVIAYRNDIDAHDVESSEILATHDNFDVICMKNGRSPQV
jgi:phosphatidylserine decarboxylase